MLAEIPQRDTAADVGTGEHRRRRRQEHLSTVRDGRDPRGAVNVDADVIRAGVLARGVALSRMHTHPHADGRTVRKSRRDERALRGCGGADRFRRAGEDDEQGIALDADLRPAVGERPAQSLSVDGEHVLEARGAKGGQQLRRALDVGEHERHGPAWKRHR